MSKSVHCKNCLFYKDNHTPIEFRKIFVDVAISIVDDEKKKGSFEGIKKRMLNLTRGAGECKAPLHWGHNWYYEKAIIYSKKSPYELNKKMNCKRFVKKTLINKIKHSLGMFDPKEE